MLTTDGNSFETMTPNGIIGRAGSSSGSAVYAGKWSGVPFYNRYNDSLDTVSYDSSLEFFIFHLKITIKVGMFQAVDCKVDLVTI